MKPLTLDETLLEQERQRLRDALALLESIPRPRPARLSPPAAPPLRETPPEPMPAEPVPATPPRSVARPEALDGVTDFFVHFDDSPARRDPEPSLPPAAQPPSVEPEVNSDVAALRPDALFDEFQWE